MNLNLLVPPPGRIYSYAVAQMAAYHSRFHAAVKFALPIAIDCAEVLCEAKQKEEQ